MNSVHQHRWLMIVWTAVLLAPAAWSLSLGLMFPLTHAACATGSREPMLWVSAVCAVLALIGGLVAWAALRRRSTPEGPASSRYLLELAVGMSAIFLLVILVMSVPIFLLDSCPRGDRYA
jgi:hypothetical protein